MFFIVVLEFLEKKSWFFDNASEFILSVMGVGPLIIGGIVGVFIEVIHKIKDKENDFTDNSLQYVPSVIWSMLLILIGVLAFIKTMN